MWRRLLQQLRNWRGRAKRRSSLMVALDSAAHTWLFRIPRQRHAIAEFCAAIEKRLPPGYAGADTLHAFQVAFDEVLTNVVAHAREFPNEPIEVLLKRDPGHVSAIVRYRGTLFDPTAEPPPDTGAGLGQRPIGGLGVHLVRELMSEFRHAYVAGFNELTLVRRA